VVSLLPLLLPRCAPVVEVKVSKYEIETAEERKKKKIGKIAKKSAPLQPKSSAFLKRISRAKLPKQRECHDDDDEKKI